MRFFYLLVLVLILTPLVIFALENTENISLRFSVASLVDWSTSQPLSLVIAAVFVLGMLSGSSLVGLLRRSFRHVTEGR
jgi:uncharacterized integral membrane protein